MYVLVHFTIKQIARPVIRKNRSFYMGAMARTDMHSETG